jgi:hypothetical protein
MDDLNPDWWWKSLLGPPYTDTLAAAGVTQQNRPQPRPLTPQDVAMIAAYLRSMIPERPARLVVKDFAYRLSHADDKP